MEKKNEKNKVKKVLRTILWSITYFLTLCVVAALIIIATRMSI